MWDSMTQCTDSRVSPVMNSTAIASSADDVCHSARDRTLRTVSKRNDD